MGGPTTKVGPLLGLLEEAMLSGLLSTPNHTSGCSGGIEAGVGEMSGYGSAMNYGGPEMKYPSWAARNCR